MCEAGFTLYGAIKAHEMYGGHYTISLNDSLTESFRMTVKSGMMRDPTLFNQTDILNEKFLAQYTTSCRAECKHERSTHECFRSELSYLAPLGSENISAPYFKHHASQSQDRNNKYFILYIEFCINNKI